MTLPNRVLALPLAEAIERFGAMASYRGPLYRMPFVEDEGGLEGRRG